MMELILYLIIISVIYLIFVLVYKTFIISARLKRYADKIPGPKPYPIIGNSGLFSKSESILKVIANVSETYGSVSRLWMGKNLLVLLNDPEDIKAILSSSKNLNKSDVYRFLEPWLGNTDLVLSKSDHWHTRRKLLTPSFHITILENSIPIISRNASILCEKMRSRLNEDEFEISLYIEKCSLDIIGEVAMGTHLKTQISERSEFLDSIKVVTALTAKRMYNPWLHPSFLFRLTKLGRTYFKNLKILKEKGREVINERKKILEENKEILVPPKSEPNGKKYLPFLDFLLTESNYSDIEVENEVNSFMFAGHDTTTTSMSFCLYALSLNQSVQNKVVKEIKSVLLKKGELTHADFYSMNYLSCVIKESMRIYPTIPVISRKITEEVKLPSGYVIPLGCLVGINIFSMHRSEKYYENALEFIPERFEQRDETRNTFSYIPFSAGPRSCIGQRFARLEMYVILSMILLEYQILPASNSEPPILEHNIVLRSLNGLRIRIKRRNLEVI